MRDIVKAFIAVISLGVIHIFLSEMFLRNVCFSKNFAHVLNACCRYMIKGALSGLLSGALGVIHIFLSEMFRRNVCFSKNFAHVLNECCRYIIKGALSGLA